jgi:very-short-patch-repair endonuclease
VRAPDFVVIGNGRAVVIEVDGPHHYGRTRKADDATRDRHWGRCGVSTIRITSEHADDPESLKALLQERPQARAMAELSLVTARRVRRRLLLSYT